MQQVQTTSPAPVLWLRRHPTPSPVFETYWRFATERQRIFHRRVEGTPPPWTDDPVLRRHRFTNVYRAADRVSQFLINEVIPNSFADPADVCFRVLLFKLFNRIATWHTLEDALGALHVETFSPTEYGLALTKVLERGSRLYSAAYIMPMPHLSEAITYKHEAHLRLLFQMVEDGLPRRLEGADSLREVYQALGSYPSLGPFLSFQYAIDLNYSELVDFSEMDFVVAGPGARSGIDKCFVDLNGWSYEDVIRWTTESAQEEFARRELDFRDLWGRPLQLIDCQNLFCEVDKYARAVHPEFNRRFGRVRIKQTYHLNPTPIHYAFPPKWRISAAHSG